MGDSDLFSLELPGSMTSKKSSDSLTLDDEMSGGRSLGEFGDSSRDPRRRRNDGMEGRASQPSKEATGSSFRGMEFGTSHDNFDTTNEFLEDDEDDILQRRRRGLSSLGEGATSSNASLEYFDDRAMVADFLRQYHCTSMMPQSSKVVVLDVMLSIRAAFHAFDENDIDSATLWCSAEKDYFGVVTIGDLLAALLAQIPDSSKIDAASVLKKLETTTLKQWMEKRHESRDLVCMEPSDSLFEALSMLSRFKVHRVPVIDRLEQNTILYVLTATKIVVFLMKIMAKRPALFETSLEKIQIGRFTGLTTASPDTSLFDTLMLIEKTRFSAIPVVDQTGKLVDTIYKSDLARIPPSELLASATTPIAQVLAGWREKGILHHSGPNTCAIEDSMEVVLTRLMVSRLRSIVIVDSDLQVKGIVALTDVLRCFLV